MRRVVALAELWVTVIVAVGAVVPLGAGGTITRNEPSAASATAVVPSSSLTVPASNVTW